MSNTKINSYITVGVDLFAKLSAGNFIKLLLIYFIFSTYNVYQGYTSLTQIAENNMYSSVEYIKYTSDSCNMIIDRKTLTLTRDLGGVNKWNKSNCADIIANTTQMASLVAKHDIGARGIELPGKIFSQVLVFVIYVCVCYSLLGAMSAITFPRTTFISICFGWLLISAAAFPFMYRSYSATTIFNSNSMDAIAMTDGRLTSDGRWLTMPRTFMGRVTLVHYPKPL
jgi:hypothetical protein